MGKGDVAIDTVQGSAAKAEIGCGALEVPQIDASVWLAWTGRGLSHLLWADAGAGRPAEIAVTVPEREIPARYAETLMRYFAGEPVDPVELPVDLHGTEFQLRVWNALRAVPRGSVRSYAGIAIDVDSPRATRAVGMANASNPVAIVVPCHRVVEKDLSIGGYSAGLKIKRFLLALEGVNVAADHVSAGQLSLI
ncbi:MAG TPA: methylated-DNA--[protein]-cysteine S-methyltransferase [Polyangiales bacterium]|jgi:O-6-methylguanine DNA methyltransferase|nr:methylated-DNA--[protein]-cysteine S-methyltransferase [Polyangiales bacterium]